MTAAAVTQLETEDTRPEQWTDVGHCSGRGREQATCAPPLCSGVARAGLVRVSARTVRYVLICNQWWWCAGGEQRSGAQLGNILAICSETENTSAARTTATSPVTRPTRGRGVDMDTGHWTLDTLISL